MKLYLAEGGSLFRKCWELDKKERGGSESVNIYLAGAEFVAGYIRQKERTNMDIYLAGTEQRGKELKKLGGGVFEDANILQSFYYCDEFIEKVIIPESKRFLLDSGAFTFFSSGKTVDWNDYIKRYADFINRNNVEHFFELDVDVLVGYDKVVDFRHRLEDMTGKPTIPVWHKSRGKENFLRMCEDYKYVAIGGIVSKEISRKEYPAFKWFISEAHKRGVKIHGLGFTNLKGLEEYKFDSVDSTAWISGNRFGGVYEFNGKTLIKHNKPEGKRMGQVDKLALHNFREWVKFSNYAEAKL